MKAVLHIDSNDTGKQSEVLGNIENLLSEEPEAEVAMVANGDAVDMVEQGSQAEEFLEDFLDRGVHVKACSNSLDNRSIESDEVIDGVEIVEAGVVALARLQEDGFSYIRP